VARWEPNPRERLAVAAHELFCEHGYQAVTVAQITERAGLTKASYFRYFTDKREVVFVGQELIVELIGRAVADAREHAGPRELVEAALAAVAVAFTADRHARAAARQAVIDAEPELRERLIAKRAAISEAITAAVQARGVAAAVARVAGQLGQLAFTTASQQWTASSDGGDFALFAREAFDSAVAAAAALNREEVPSRIPDADRSARA
jgi:AcrR family transcriptional regulator